MLMIVASINCFNDYRLPVDKYPVVALRGAPAPFPMAEENIPLAKYLQWSDNIEEEVGSHIQKLMGNEKFIGIHLRNGVDWVYIANSSTVLILSLTSNVEILAIDTLFYCRKSY